MSSETFIFFAFCVNRTVFLPDFVSRSKNKLLSGRGSCWGFSRVAPMCPLRRLPQRLSCVLSIIPGPRTDLYKLLALLSVIEKRRSRGAWFSFFFFSFTLFHSSWMKSERCTVIHCRYGALQSIRISIADSRRTLQLKPSQCWPWHREI